MLDLVGVDPGCGVGAVGAGQEVLRYRWFVGVILLVGRHDRGWLEPAVWWSISGRLRHAELGNGEGEGGRLRLTGRRSCA